MENLQIDRRRKSKSISCSRSLLDDLKRERFCQSKVNIKLEMEEKNKNKLTLLNGAETGNPKTVNGSDSVKSTPSPSSPMFAESFARRRTSSVSLPKLKIPHNNGEGDTTTGAQAAAAANNRPELQEAAEEGFSHFTEFLVDEIERNGLKPPADLQEDVQSARVLSTGSQTDNHPPGSPTPPTATPTGYRHPDWAKRGKGLRKLADVFAQTNERKKVQEKAQGVESTETISFEQFRDLLSELFPQGVITRERIVVLFFFCTDIAILALQQNHLELFHRLVRWTLEYIRSKVCMWVANQGGWGAVLSSSVDYLYRGAQIAAAGLLLYFAYKLVTNATSNTSGNK